MTVAKKKAGRPRLASPLTATERDQRYREKHDLVSIRIPRATAHLLDKLADGTEGRGSVVERLAETASQGEAWAA